MPIFNNILAGASGQATGYDIDQSLRFNDDDSASLLWTPSGNGNRRTWTVSFWTKRGHISDISYIFTANSYNNFCGFGSADQIQILAGNGSTFDIQSTQVFRDPSAWYHMVYVIDTTESTDSNRVKCWANGSEVTLAVSGGGWPSLNQELDFNTTVAFGVGGNTTYNYDGYLAEFHFIDGTALTPASFGETNSSTNQWVPIEYTGSYGTNGFYQKYSATELANSFTDSSEAGGRHNISASGDAHTDTSVKKIGTASVQFDGTGDYLTAPSNDDWDFGTGDFTLEMWIRFANKNTGSGAAGANALIANHNSPNGWQWIWRGSDNTFELWSTDGDEYSSSFTLNNDTWYHVAVTRDGNTLRHYVDGVQCGSNAFTETMSDTSTTLQIGSYDASGLGIIDGYMDEIRISDTCRYPDGTTFTPSTTAFTADSNTRLLLHCDGSDGGTSFPDSATRVITANGDVANSRAQAKIGESSIKFDGTADYLSVADSADWALGSNFTVETWVRFASTSSDLTLLNHWKGNGVLASWSLQLDGGNTAKFYYSTDGVNSAGNSSWSWTPSLNTWYHVAVVRDGSDLEFYVDGTQTGSTYDISSSTIANIAWPLEIGYYSNIGSYGLNGYMDEIRISNSTRYTGAFTPSTTAFTADSNTKLLIHSDFDGGLGADSSGNTNDFSATNLVATDQVLDSPTNNFATLSPIAANTNGLSCSILTEGNLKIPPSSSATRHVRGATIDNSLLDGGKWYYEVYVGSANSFTVGYRNAQDGDDTPSVEFEQDGQYKVDGSNSGSATGTISDGDILGVLLDWSNTAAKTFAIYVNNSLVGSAKTFTANTSGYNLFARGSDGSGNGGNLVYNFGQDSSFAGAKTAQGNGGVGEDFYYAPPTGFKALNTDNLDDPAIALPTDHFEPIIYTGTGSTRTVATSFASDLVWLKRRDGTENHVLYDTIRGGTNALRSNVTNAEGQFGDAVITFNSANFQIAGTDVSGLNGSGETQVAWTWKAGGTASSNTDGAITSSVSANTTAGFSIVSYTGSGTNNTTVGHGLSQTPTLWILKNRSSGSSNWETFTTVIDGSVDFLRLDSTDAKGDSGRTAPTSSVFYVGNSTNQGVSGDNYIAYCFHSVDGYSKVGSYTGNSSTDGPFIYTGFRPAYVMIKRYDSSTGARWLLLDNARNTYNVVNKNLIADEAYSESTVGDTDRLDFVSNGFKLRQAGTTVNVGSYIYLAFAESPFKTSNAR